MARKTAKAGAKTSARKAAPDAPEIAASEDETPVDYMLRVMRDPDAAPQRRDIMAKSATPYIHAKPATKKKRSGNGETALKRRLESARETLAGKIAQLRTDGS